MKKNFSLAIIGGGPAGIMAALTAIKNQSVILIEKNETLGRKILATGNGRCNLTNRLVNPSRYHGGSPKFIKNVLESFSQFQTMKLIENLGVILKEEDNGRIFPRSNQAQTVVDALVEKLREDQVVVKTSSAVKKINRFDSGFQIILNSGQVIEADKLIISTGGKAASHLGSTGDAYYWAELLGHTITKTYPALVPIETVETWPKEISGLRVEGKSYITIDEKIISEKTGDILFTHFGLSAPAVMAHASSIAEHLGKNLQIHLDLFPENSIKELDQLLAKLFDCTGKKTLKNTLSGLIANNLVPVILQLLEINADKKTAEVSKTDREKIAKKLKDITLTVKDLRPFKEAQVTHGGISLEEIEAKTLQSKIVPNLYFAGEVLDVDGDSGGFNLQWAWSSGHLAGQTLK